MKNQQQNTDISTNLSSDYESVVRDVIEAHFIDTLRSPFDNVTMGKTVARWMELFIEARIPASKLMQVYNTAIRSQKTGDYFTVTNILSAWDVMQIEAEQRIQIKDRDCQICKGTGKAFVMSFETGADEERDCICASYSNG